MANALYWVDEFHIDGLRVDAVASMLYLDYSRKPGQWVPNERGGRENLERLEFIRDLNMMLHGAHPGVLTIAEESTSWPAVTAPVHHGGLGFTHKWNMGWMHDTLDYLRHDPVHRKHHHRNLTFGLLYAYTENFVLPLSHDEVVHGKGPLIDKMAGDEWQKFANLRALYGWMYAYPGRKLLFMGSEIGQTREWHHDRSLDWWLLDWPPPRGRARSRARAQRRRRVRARVVGVGPRAGGVPLARRGRRRAQHLQLRAVLGGRASSGRRVSRTSRPFHARDTGSACPTQARGRRFSTRTQSGSGALGTAASPASRRSQWRGTATATRRSSRCRRSRSCGSRVRRRPKRRPPSHPLGDERATARHPRALLPTAS